MKMYQLRQATVSVAVCELFSVKACDLGNWVRVKVIGNGTI